MKKYNTNPIIKRVPVIISLLILAGMIVLNLTAKEVLPEPDAEFPMANARISWQQTFHEGAWEE